MAIDAKNFRSLLIANDYDFFAGVPDSLLKDFCECLKSSMPRGKYQITANEGSAIGLAVGYHIATKRHGVVFMQNSGIGNAVNPLLSIADPAVYSIPLLMVIGWRGRPGEPDEPQHAAQGRQTIPLLNALDIPFAILDEACWESQLKQMMNKAKEHSRPCAIIITKGFFSPVETTNPSPRLKLTREKALEILVNATDSRDYVVCTTGKASRELFEIRERLCQPHNNDLLVIGGMGHASSIAAGMAMGCSNNIWCFDGDGSFLMHMGALPSLINTLPKNFKYIINVNGVHESVGGQPTTAMELDLLSIFNAMGFASVSCAKDATELASSIQTEQLSNCPSAIIVYTAPGSRSNLGRPTLSPRASVEALMNSIAKSSAPASEHDSGVQI